MKIAFIHPFFFRLARGIERITHDLANAFTKKGIDVTLITWKTKNPTNILKFDPRVKIHAWPTFRYYESKTIIPFYIYDILKNNYDIVNIHFSCYGENEALYYASFIKKTKFNIIYHYPFAQVPERYLEFNKNNLWEKADYIISTSQFVADGVKEVFDNKESTIIINGVDIEFFKPDYEMASNLRKEMNLSHESKVLLTASAFEERKGIQHIIKALPEILKVIPNTKLIILGEGGYGDKLKELVRKLNINEDVIFYGISSKINMFYNLADIFLLLSHGEASPMAPMEALSTGTPVITSNHRPFDEIIHPDCGVMVNEQNSVEVANTVTKLLKNNKKRLKMGKNARKYIVENFSWDKVADKYINIFRKELKGND